VARHLADRSELTIITNAINIAMELTMRPRLRVFVTGGLMRSESYELVGAWTERFLESLNIAVAIMGVDGISADGGLTTHDAVEARTNQRMIERAQRVVVVADGSKLGQVTMAKMADVGEVDLLITAADAPADQVALLRAAGLDIRLVPVT
jgi:DeoR family transcriptional regulator of aga operon